MLLGLKLSPEDRRVVIPDWNRARNNQSAWHTEVALDNLAEDRAELVVEVVHVLAGHISRRGWWSSDPTTVDPTAADKCHLACAVIGTAGAAAFGAPELAERHNAHPIEQVQVA